MHDGEKKPAAAAKAKAPRAQPRQERAKPTTNPRLTQQSRKVLGKHYANRYGKR